MKKLIISAAVAVALVGWVQNVSAAGAVNLSNYFPDRPIFEADGTTKAPSFTVQLLDNASMTPFTEKNTANTTWNAVEPGRFFADNSYGTHPNHANNATGVSLRLRAWKGGATWDDATHRGEAVWTQDLGADADPPTPADLNIPAPGIELDPATNIPEPATLALGLLGGATLLFRRRKAKS